MNINHLTAKVLVLTSLCTAAAYAQPVPTDTGSGTAPSQRAAVSQTANKKAKPSGGAAIPLPSVNPDTKIDGYYEAVSNQAGQVKSQYVADPNGLMLTLQDAMEVSLRQNPTIRVAEENVVSANARYAQAKSAKNLQVVVGNKTTWQNRQTSGNIVTLNGLSNQLSTSLRMLLTTFGQVENQIAAAYLNIGVEALNAAAVKQELCYSVKQAFFERLKADASVDVAAVNLQVSKQSLGDSEKLFAQGVMAWYDVIQADLAVTEGNEQLARAESSVKTANANLLKLLAQNVDSGGPSVTLVEPAPIEVDETCTLEALQRVALARRFEIISLDRSVEVLEKTRQATKSSNLPEVFLSADYIFSPGYNTYPSSIYQLNLNVNWAAWDGGEQLAKLEELDSQLRSLASSREELCNSIRLAVEQAFIQFNLTQVTLKTAMKRVDAAWVYYNMARQRFLNGMGTSLEVQDALSSLNSARQALVVAVYDRDLAFAAIEYCIGVDFPGRRLGVTPDMLLPLEEVPVN